MDTQDQGQLPLFDDPISRISDSVTEATATHFRALTDGDLLDVGELIGRVQAYSERIQEVAKKREFVDVETAEFVSRRCRDLLAGITEATSPSHRQLIQAAVLYFLQEDDAEGDTTSMIGFDDDAKIVELVAREVGREDLLQS